MLYILSKIIKSTPLLHEKQISQRYYCHEAEFPIITLILNVFQTLSKHLLVDVLCLFNEIYVYPARYPVSLSGIATCLFPNYLSIIIEMNLQ